MFAARLWREPPLERIHPISHPLDAIKDRASIHDRPKTIESRGEAGHWEGDLIICKCTRPVLVLHERKSRVTLAARLTGKTAAETVSAMLAVFGRIDPHLRRSITLARPLSSDAKCDTPRRFDVGKVVQDLKECCHAIYSHLSGDERDQIGVLRAAGRSIGAIARALGRAKATIFLQRNALPLGGYSPLHAAGAYQLRRRREAILERESDFWRS